MWCPPTPPQDENDVYIDQTMCFLFEPSVMPESDLPPIYIKKEHKRIRVDPVLGKFGKHSGTIKTAYLQRLMSPCGLIYIQH